MKTLIALRMIKERGRNAGTKAEMQARQKHKQRREEEEVVQQISNFSRVE